MLFDRINQAAEDYILVAMTEGAKANNLLQITIPCGHVKGCPVGLGIVGPRGSDEALLESASKIYKMLSE